MKEGEVADLLGMSIAALRRWRLIRKGPKYIKIGAAVRYRPHDVEAWIATQPTGGEEPPTSDSFQLTGGRAEVSGNSA